MDWELAHLVALLPAAACATLAGRCVYSTEVRGQPLVLVASGMGMLRAAACTEFVLNRYAPRAVLNYGCAGAHRSDLLPGDLVVGTHVVAYDDIREAPDGVERFGGAVVPCDGALVEHALRAAESVVHEPWPADLAWPPGVPHRAPRVVAGVVASADRWNRAPATIARLVEWHGSVCEEMEAAAIGTVCALHGVPFLTLKDISNNELLRQTPSGTAMVAESGTDQLARRAAAFAYATLQRLVT